MRKKSALFVTAMTAVLLTGAAGARAQGRNGDINFLIAGKSLDKDKWGPTDQQGEAGLLSNWQGRDWPVALAVDLLAANRNASISAGGFTEQKAKTSELDLGVRKVWRTDARFRPYAGGGLALASAQIDKTGPGVAVSEHDNGTGVWLDGGVFWTLSEVFNLGFDVRLSGASVRLYGVERNAGGLHLGMMAGYHWGG
jgi:opacity protein-like surface antigen